MDPVPFQSPKGLYFLSPSSSLAAHVDFFFFACLKASFSRPHLPVSLETLD
jgi:hypothetical protein